jgi:hypothetical protein
LFDRVEKLLGVRLVGVLAEAGCGKTQLAAQLTAPEEGRPAGVLLHGRDLHAGQTLNDLARHFVLAGQPMPSIEALLAALDAAGQRANRRLPLVIDGLNEAEDPRDWRPLLASLNETLIRYPYVLVVCTIRGAFAGEALPVEAARLEIPDFGSDFVEAIRAYFHFYRIDAIDADLPVELLKHPLTLRLFCEVTNPTRQQTVGIEAMPGSLSVLFDRYLDQAAQRIAELSPLTHRYYEQDVRSALDQIGAVLWDRSTRGIDIRSLRHLLRDDSRPWDQSLVRALEQEGVVLRIPGEAGASGIAPVFDALGGHLVADAMLARHGQAGIEAWVVAQDVAHKLGGPFENQHPLADDILRALVGLCPRRLHRKQLWQLVNEPLRDRALRFAADLEGAYLDAETVNELVATTRAPAAGSRDLFDRLWQTRGSTSHPLNAEFLDRVLRPMMVAERDLRWTEWIRHRSQQVVKDLQWLEHRWLRNVLRNGDDLRARWVMWTLTSTVHDLRDRATRTLYWFGRTAPARLFTLTVNALAINDAYVSERMLAASYGVAMAQQRPNTEFSDALSSYLAQLATTLVGAGATHPTNHWLARTYVRGTFELARAHVPSAVPPAVSAAWPLAFATGPMVAPIPDDDPRVAVVRRTLHMDFENYTLGSLFEDRANYDMKHRGHRAAVAHVRGVVWNCGWREEAFKAVEEHLSSDWSRRSERARTERYGKKYGWLGFYTYAGILQDKSRFPRDRRLAEVDLDPSFPTQPIPDSSLVLHWLSPAISSDQEWIERGHIVVPDELFYRRAIGSNEGPWLAVEGYLRQDDKLVGRRVFAFISAVAVAARNAAQFSEYLLSAGHPARRIPDGPRDYYTFAGEIPWSPEFGTRDIDGEIVSLYRTRSGPDGAAMPIESLSHEYAWESYHSVLNEAGETPVPSRLFSAAFDLRGGAQTFDQTTPDGSVATVTTGAPQGFKGHILYLREDLVKKFLGRRRLVWFAWGERGVHPFPYSPPEWLNQARQQGLDTWRIVRHGDELSMALRLKDQRQVGRAGAAGKKRASKSKSRVRKRGV